MNKYFPSTAPFQHYKMVYIPKSGRFSCVFKNKLLSCKIFLKKRLSKVIPHFKNAVNDKGACRVYGDWWTDLSNKNCWFTKHKDYLTDKKIKEKKMEIKQTLIYPMPLIKSLSMKKIS